MRTSENIDKVMPAFVKFQKEVKNPKKDTEGYGYKYAKLDTVIAVVKEGMEGKGLAFNQSVGYDQQGNVCVTTNIIHESGQWLSFGPLGLPKDDGQQRSQVQAAGSSITYARRYSLSAAMGLASEQDTDGTGKKKNYKNKNKKVSLKEIRRNDLKNLIKGNTTKDDVFTEYKSIMTERGHNKIDEPDGNEWKTIIEMIEQNLEVE